MGWRTSIKQGWHEGGGASDLKRGLDYGNWVDLDPKGISSKIKIPAPFHSLPRISLEIQITLDVKNPIFIGVHELDTD